LIVPLEGINLKKVDDYNSVIEFIKKINLISKRSNVNLSFEFNGDISIFKKIIDDTKIINLKITFDTGNFFVKNRNLVKTLKQYETYINHVHLKDRDKFGNNVVLGTGLINFSQVMKFLKSKNYKKCLTFETHRGTNAILTANKNFSQIKNFS
jgi:sugar phosphate isomerase/epimerase